MTKTHKRKIVTLAPMGNPPRSITSQYKDKRTNKIVSLLRDGTVVEGTLTPEQENKLDSLTFMDGKPIKFVIDTEDDDCIDYKRVDFYKKCNFSFVPMPNGENANENCKTALFRLIDHEEGAKNELKALKLSLAVQNKVNNTTPQSQFNLAFALGFKTEDKTIEEILLAVWKKALADPFEFVKLLGREDLESLVVIRKAIALKVIEIDRGVLMYNTIPVGNGEPEAAIQQAQAYFANNEEQFKMLRKKVAMNDNLPVRFNEENVGAIVFEGDEPEETVSKTTNATKRK